MLASLSRPYRAGSIFTAGPRSCFTRDQRRAWMARANLERRRGRLTALHVVVAHALQRRLGNDGRLDPAHATIAADAGCSARTVRRALARLRELGMLRWTCRLVRVPGWRSAQTSNAYALVLPAVAVAPACDGQPVRETPKEDSKKALNKRSEQRKLSRQGSQEALAARMMRVLAQQMARRTMQHANAEHGTVKGVKV